MIQKILIISLLLLSLDVFSQWENVSVPDVNNIDLLDIDFINDSTGFLSTDNENNPLYFTNNSGDSWSEYSSNNFSLPVGNWDCICEGVDFINDSVGFNIISASITDNIQHLWIYKTVDSGVHWVQVSDLVTSSSDYITFDFITNTHGVISKSNHLFTTQDGFDSWNDVDYGELLKPTILDTNHIIMGISGLLHTSDDFGLTFSQVDSIVSNPYRDKFSRVNDSTMFFYGERLFKTSNFGASWEQTTDKQYALYSILAINNDTVFFGLSNSVLRSVNGGEHFEGQQTSDDDFKKYSHITYSGHTVYLLGIWQNTIIKSENWGGVYEPSISVENFSHVICGPDTLLIKNTSNPLYDLEWKMNGELLDTSYNLTLIYDTTFAVRTDSVYLVGSNGYLLDSLLLKIRFGKSKVAPSFVAYLDSISDCSTQATVVKIYPYYSSYEYRVFGETNQVLTITGAEGDTGTCVIPLLFDSAYTIRCEIDGYGCSGPKIPFYANLQKTIKPYQFTSEQEIVFEKPVFCMNDSLKVSILNTDPSAKYWLERRDWGLDYDYTDTLMGNGAALEFYFPQVLRQNNFKIYYSRGECVSYSQYYSFPVEYFKNTIYTTPFYNLETGTAIINRYIDEDYYSSPIIDEQCFWEMTSEENITSYSNCNINFLNFNSTGIHTIRNDFLTNNGCSYREDTTVCIVANLRNTDENNSCGVTENGLHQKILDVHEGKDSCIYTAGYYIEPNIMSSTYHAPVYKFSKYDKNLNLLWSKQMFYEDVIGNTSGYNAAYATGITTDDDKNIYVSGSAANKNFQIDSIYKTNTHRNTAYIVKMDSIGEVIWCKIFDRFNSAESSVSSPNAITDLEVLDGKLYATLKSETVQTYTNTGFNEWEEGEKINHGDYLIKFDLEGNIEQKEFINPTGRLYLSYNAFNYAGGNYSKGHTLNSGLHIDKQNRLVVHLIARGTDVLYFGNMALEIPESDKRATSSYGMAIEAYGIYDPEMGWISGKAVYKGLSHKVAEYNNHNLIQTDAHGNKYTVINWGHSNSDFTNDLVYPHGGARLIKYDVNWNVLWKKEFYHNNIVDIKLTSDELHLGIALYNNTDNPAFVFEENNTLNDLRIDKSQAVYMQLSNTSEIEKIYQFGPSNTKPIFLYGDEYNFINLAAFVESEEDSMVIMGNDTLSDRNWGNYYEYYGGVTYKIDENNNCSENPFQGRLEDTLFLHLPIDTFLCSNMDFVIPWIATESVDFVNIGYYKYGDTTKFYIQSHVLASEYSIEWNVNVEDVDRIKFFIEDTFNGYYNESVFYSISFMNNDILLCSDTIICPGTNFEIEINSYDNDLEWGPFSLFEDPDLDSNQIIFLDSNAIITVLASASNGCYAIDTINIEIFEILDDSILVEVTNNEILFYQQNANDSIHWYLNNSYVSNNESELITAYKDSIYALTSFTFYSCNIDTNSVVLDFNVPSDTITICYGDSLYLSNAWQVDEALYFDYNESVITSTFMDTITHIYIYQNFTTCNEGVYIVNHWVNESGLYFDTIQVENSCDSVYISDVTINNSNYSFDELSSCDSIQWIDGEVYSESNNTATFTTANMFGCDSIIQLDLQINNIDPSFDTQMACDSLKWINGFTYYESINTENFLMSSENGCDSVIYLDLTINYTNNSTSYQTACNSYQWVDGNTYTEDNDTATFIFINQFGCDSVVTLDLQMNEINVDVALTDTSIMAIEQNAAYRWINCADSIIIEGMNSQSFYPNITGSYAVELTQNSCLDTSICNEIVKEIEVVIIDDQISVYPNPTEGIVNLNLQNWQNVSIKVYSSIGKLVFSDDRINSPSYQFVLDVAPDSYIIEIISGELKKEFNLILK